MTQEAAPAKKESGSGYATLVFTTYLCIWLFFKKKKKNLSIKYEFHNF